MVRLGDENSRGKVQNVCEGSSVIFLSAASVVVYGCLSILRAFATVIAWSAVLAIICYLCLANIPTAVEITRRRGFRDRRAKTFRASKRC